MSLMLSIFSAGLKPSGPPRHMHCGGGGAHTLLSRVFQNWKMDKPSRSGSARQTSQLQCRQMGSLGTCLLDNPPLIILVVKLTLYCGSNGKAK